MIGTKGRSNIRQYMPKKIHKWGIKVFTRCGISGMVYDFIIYTDKIKTPQEVDLEACANVVIHLTNSLTRTCFFLVYFNNYYTSLKLLSHLRNRLIYCIGTMRQNRLQGAKEHVEKKKLKKKDRGSFQWCASPKMGVTVIS